MDFDFSLKGVLTLLLPLFKGIIILIAGYIITKCIIRIADKGLKKGRLDISLINFIEKAIKIVCYVIVLMAALSAVGISTTGIIAAFSAAGVAIALALKDSLSNIAGGIILLIAPRFSTGDHIKESEYEGIVVSVDLMHTTIRTFDNLQVAIPNGLLMNNQIVNYSREENRRIDLVFPIAYSDDPQKAKAVAEKTARAHKKVLSSPEVFARVGEYGESSVNIHLKAWCKTSDFAQVKYDLLEQVRESLDREGIEIPFNRLDIQIRNN
ncbi:MAG: mechanosensitive ion channel family protein [Clostridia bacterium]|nr:mechanosensitive ion channel family protein [Clostridia bacterium]